MRQGDGEFINKQLELSLTHTHTGLPGLSSQTSTDWAHFSSDDANPPVSASLAEKASLRALDLDLPLDIVTLSQNNPILQRKEHLKETSENTWQPCCASLVVHSGTIFSNSHHSWVTRFRNLCRIVYWLELNGFSRGAFAVFCTVHRKTAQRRRRPLPFCP